MRWLAALVLWPGSLAADTAVVRVSATVVSSVTVEIDGPFARATFFGVPEADRPGVVTVNGIDLGPFDGAWALVDTSEALAWSD